MLNMLRYRSFGAYMREKFGSTVYKVNVDAGFTCPNRDGTLVLSGCIYCNNDSFRPGPCRPAIPISEQVRNGVSYVKKRYKADQFLVYFQPFTNTYAPVETLEKLYNEALQEPSVIGLAIGTRPDAVDIEKIQLLEELASRYFILVEYGLQSIYDKSLEFINRGHDYRAFLTALQLTEKRGIHTGAHLIAGFPTESPEETMAMADEISTLPLEFLKVHQLQVIRNTPMEKMYRENPFHTFGYEEYLNFITGFVERLSPEIVLQRLFATAPDEILIAPLWGRHRHGMLQDIEKKFAANDSFQGKRFKRRIVA